MNSLFKSIDNLPSQVKEQVFIIFNKTLEQYEYISQEGYLFIKTINRCISSSNYRALIHSYDWCNTLFTMQQFIPSILSI